jgi:deoxyribonuclease-4
VRIGAHVPTRGGTRSAVRAALECGAEAVQIFVSNPRSWAHPRVSPGDADAFREAFAAAGLGPLFVHVPYLVNIASPNPQFLAKSIGLARHSLTVCSQIGAAGLVVHAGSGGRGDPGKALERAAGALRAMTTESDTPVVVELTAGTVGSVASTFPQAARLFAAVGEPRLLLCADTCHLFAAGYALAEREGVAACFDELHPNGLADRLVLLHANDARYGRGTHRDRHQHIGQGHIGTAGFREILRRPEVQDLAIVVEAPGSLEDCARNIATLRGLAT